MLHASTTCAGDAQRTDMSQAATEPHGRSAEAPQKRFAFNWADAADDDDDSDGSCSTSDGGGGGENRDSGLGSAAKSTSSEVHQTPLSSRSKLALPPSDTNNYGYAASNTHLKTNNNNNNNNNNRGSRPNGNLGAVWSRAPAHSGACFPAMNVDKKEPFADYINRHQRPSLLPALLDVYCPSRRDGQSIQQGVNINATQEEEAVQQQRCVSSPPRIAAVGGVPQSGVTSSSSYCKTASVRSWSPSLPASSSSFAGGGVGGLLTASGKCEQAVTIPAAIPYTLKSVWSPPLNEYYMSPEAQAWCSTAAVARGLSLPPPARHADPRLYWPVFVVQREPPPGRSQSNQVAATSCKNSQQELMSKKKTEKGEKETRQPRSSAISSTSSSNTDDQQANINSSADERGTTASSESLSSLHLKSISKSISISPAEAARLMPANEAQKNVGVAANGEVAPPSQPQPRPARYPPPSHTPAIEELTATLRAAGGTLSYTELMQLTKWRTRYFKRCNSLFPFLKGYKSIFKYVEGTVTLIEEGCLVNELLKTTTNWAQATLPASASAPMRTASPQMSAAGPTAGKTANGCVSQRQ